MNNFSETPCWNLDSIFSSLESDEYKSALLKCNSLFDTLEQLLETAGKFIRESNSNFDFCLWLKSFIDAKSEHSKLLKTLSAYAYVIYSTDTTNTSYLNNLDAVEKLNIRDNDINIQFTQVIVSHQIHLEDFYARFPEYEQFRFLIEEILEDAKHQLTPAEEKLAALLQQTGGNAWGNLQEQIISNLHDEDGKTFNELRNDAYSEDAELRKKSWQSEINLLKQNRIALAACLTNLKGETVTLNKKRGWNFALDRALFFSRIKHETLDALVSCIEDSLPMWRSYFKAKAAYLKKHGMTSSNDTGGALAFYDLFAPLSHKNSAEGLLTKKWTFKEASEYVIQKYDSFSREMGDFARKVFKEGWVDARVRAGKVGGAYDEDFPLGHQSRILTNFTGSFSDIITLAHEAGHAYHFSCMKQEHPFFFDYPMTLAETASTFAETIVKQELICEANDEEKIQILDLDLQDAAQVLVDILCRFYFERSVFEEREKGVLSADDFCRLMAEAQQKTYGEGLGSERHEYMWAVKSHYYSTELDFYNFPYAFGQLLALALYERSISEGPSFAKTYSLFLSQTGSDSCEAVCKKAGFDITQKSFWEKGIQIYKKEVESFIALTEK